MHQPSKVGALIIGAGILAAAAFGLWYARSRQADTSAAVAGIVRTTEIHIAPEISGRLASVLVKPGQAVQLGEPLALLSNPELWATVVEARAQVEKAASDRDRVYAGLRQEEVEALQREIFKAQAALVLARQGLARKTSLVARSDTSVQDLDEARAEAARCEADVAVAEARYAEAQLGPTPEERALADAQVRAAEAARDVVEAKAAKMLLHAPAAGVVGLIVPEIGEAVVPGEPILTLVPAGGFWFGFNLREDALGGLSIGSRVPIDLPGAAGRALGTLAEMRNWGEFAAWRAARASDDHDLNTFFLRVDPVTPTPSLAAGQTVWLNPIRYQ
ncbi:MAG: biotin/lipoyl-binding protein [Rhodopila sp.]|nr:biotin/lipoyl-binding protein [Rhodopila sp.]